MHFEHQDLFSYNFLWHHSHFCNVHRCFSNSLLQLARNFGQEIYFQDFAKYKEIQDKNSVMYHLRIIAKNTSVVFIKKTR